MSRLPRGCSNVYGDLARKMNVCRTMFLSEFSLFGYSPFLPTGIQLLETTWERLPTSLRNRLIVLNSPFGEPCCMRTDITLAAATYLASHFSPGERPLRLSYGDRIYMAPQKPDISMESYQIGAEFLGWEEEGAEVEMMFLLLRYLENTGIKNARIVIGDVSILRGIMQGISPSLRERITHALAKGNFSDYYEILNQLEIDDMRTSFLRELPELKDGTETLERTTALLGDSTLIEPVKRIYDSLKKLGHERQVQIDLALVRELDYYSGPVFDFYLEKYGRPFGGGGRYDGLLDYFDIKGQAMGFALDLEVIASFSRLNEKSRLAIVWTGGQPAAKVFPEIIPITEKNVTVELSWTSSRSDSHMLSRNRNAYYWIDLSGREIINLREGTCNKLDEWLGDSRC